MGSIASQRGPPVREAEADKDADRLRGVRFTNGRAGWQYHRNRRVDKNGVRKNHGGC